MSRRPFLTKFWLGRRYVYIPTRRRYRLRTIGRAGIISYRRTVGPDT